MGHCRPTALLDRLGRRQKRNHSITNSSKAPLGAATTSKGHGTTPPGTAGTISDPTEHGQPSAKASAAPQKPHFFTPELPMGWGTVALRHWEGRGEEPSRLGACLPACHPITATELTSLLLIGSRQLINTIMA